MRRRKISTGTKLFDTRKVLMAGGVGVLPTDTVYAVVGSALRKDIVGRIYALRKRNLKKPMIILIGSVEQLDLFGIKADFATRKPLKNLWPGKVSVVLPVIHSKLQVARWKYLHRGTKSLAFRLPRKKALRNLLREVGPLVAPSANLEGEPPAKTIKEAKKYFGNKVDFYVDAGPLRSKPSTLIKIERGNIVVLRQGALRIKG